jgi:DNA-binding transcriptional ArsR family regulator
MIFTSLAMLGSMLMIGLQIVSHTGYGAPLLATAVGVWAVATACIWPIFQRSTKAGYTKRFLTSLVAYFILYGVALGVGVSLFRDAIQVSDSVLSKQLAVLEKAGYVKIRKSFVGKLPRTSASLAPDGRGAWTGHLQTLRDIAGGYGSEDDPCGNSR